MTHPADRVASVDPAGPGPSTRATAATPAETAAMDRALELAAHGPAHGPNPRVGCVLLDRDGHTLAEGFHRGAGTPHAEVAALCAARDRGAVVTGSTAVVTLEPCNHTGRTGPCTEALLGAGVARVVYAVDDPNQAAAGGAQVLRSAGVDVVGGVRRVEAERLLGPWLFAVRHGRPFVTLKIASTLDGRVAAADGTSRWITSAQSRAHAHRVRAEVDAIAVGTGTALADDPSLTARGEDDAPVPHQPLRVVVGHRDVPPGARLRGPGGELVTVPTREVGEVLDVLAQREVRHLLVEGGPRLATAFLRAGVVDRVHAYLAPVLLGAGTPSVQDLGVATLAEALRLRTGDVVPLGPDVLVVADTRAALDARTEED